jgi:hypothetical protein
MVYCRCGYSVKKFPDHPHGIAIMNSFVTYQHASKVHFTLVSIKQSRSAGFQLDP